MRWSIFSLFGSKRPAQRPRHTKLGVESLEGRRLMAAVPGMDAYNKDVVASENLVKADRQQMTTIFGQAIPPAYRNDLGLGAMVFEFQGGYVIYGTNGRDVVNVEEKPESRIMRTNDEFYIQVISTDGHGSIPLQWHLPRDPGKATTVYFFGMNGDDNFRFDPLPGTKTKIWADGGGGADVMSGGPNADFLDGGSAGLDIDRLTGCGGSDLMAGGGGNDLMWGDADLQNFGKPGDDVMLGEDGEDRLLGDTGNDILIGGAFDDFLQGDAGNDHLYGDSGRDWLNGGKDKDYLDGGMDSVEDNLIGGSEADEFMQRVNDWIRDWHSQEGDKRSKGSVGF